MFSGWGVSGGGATVSRVARSVDGVTALAEEGVSGGGAVTGSGAAVLGGGVGGGAGADAGTEATSLSETGAGTGTGFATLEVGGEAGVGFGVAGGGLLGIIVTRGGGAERWPESAPIVMRLSSSN